MTPAEREKKIKDLLMIAKGELRPQDTKEPPELHWLWSYNHGIEDHRYHGGGKVFTEAQFDAYCKKHGEQHVFTILRLPHNSRGRVDREFDSDSDYQKPNSKEAPPQPNPASNLPAIEQTVTQETTAKEVFKKDKEPAQEVKPKPKPLKPEIITGPTEQKIKINGIPYEELDWQDSDPISYMFPRRR